MWPLLMLLPMAMAELSVRLSAPKSLGLMPQSFRCLYQTHGEQLYTLKWSKDRTEFLMATRWQPGQQWDIKLFPVQGLEVTPRSDEASTLLVRATGPQATGRYECEVSVHGTFETRKSQMDIAFNTSSHLLLSTWILYIAIALNCF